MKTKLERIADKSPHESRLLEFGRYPKERRKRKGRGKPETFDFLGFTFYCGETQAGRFCVIPKTNGNRLNTKAKRNEAMVKEQSYDATKAVDAGTQLKTGWALPVLWSDIQYPVTGKVSLLHDEATFPLDESQKSEEKLQLGVS